MSGEVNSIKDIILFGANASDIAAMKKKIKNYKHWLIETGLPNDLDNWSSYCEMVANEE